jgi:hypothetical protein
LIGLVDTGIFGILSGAVDITQGRRLWPLIISLYLPITLAMTMIYLEINMVCHFCTSELNKELFSLQRTTNQRPRRCEISEKLALPD